MIASGELDGWDIAEIGMQAFTVVQLLDEPAQMLLSILQTRYA